MSEYAVYEGKLVPVDELMHHGVKGMKWGVRRYQNPDGSLTEAGRKRYYGYGTLDTEGKAAYKSYKKINGELVGQATRRASVIGGLAGGAIGLATGGPAGAFAGLMGSMVLSTVATATINTGAAWVSNKKYKKALIKQADEKRHAQEIRDNAQKKDNEFYKKVIDSAEKRSGRKLTDKEKADEIKSYSKEGRGEEAAKKYLEQEKSKTFANNVGDNRKNDDITKTLASVDDYKRSKVKPVSGKEKENLDALKANGYNTDPSVYDVQNKRNKPLFASKEIAYTDRNGKTQKTTIDIDIDDISDAKYAESVRKNAVNVEKNISKIRNEFEKQLSTEINDRGLNPKDYKNARSNIYVNDAFAEISINSDDVFGFSSYIDPETGKLEKIMYND